jgi:Fe-S cluster biogenesis protein NfuA
VAATDIDHQELDDRLQVLSNLIATHAGGVEVVDLSEDGTLHLRFTGMCQGCPYRPLTMAATIRPSLLAVDGITGVVAAGSRISEEAESRLAAVLQPTLPPIPDNRTRPEHA